MIFRKLLNKAAINPKKLFLIDSLGATLSATLYVVLAQFENTFGVPPKALYFLCFLAAAYALYGGVCYLLNLKHWRPYLAVIAAANWIHCFLTIGLVFYYYEIITVLGMLYFIGELVIVSSLAFIEFKTALKGIDQ